MALATLHLLACVEARNAAAFRGFHRLAADHASGGLQASAQRPAMAEQQPVIDFFSSSLASRHAWEYFCTVEMGGKSLSGNRRWQPVEAMCKRALIISRIGDLRGLPIRRRSDGLRSASTCGHASSG